ncbi:MAG: Wzz/FepE/Etk N-terminal domain-containing protein [Gammaproteobacteria bacterium]|nr:Wzz/FepE/Etk N-terminal domain-containing protein [Gammaproteobacteria bacterium]
MNDRQVHQVTHADDEIDLFELWDILWAGKLLVLACTLIASVIAVGYALVATEVYEAKVVLLPADEEKGGGLSALAGQFGGLAALAGVNLPSAGGGTSAEAIEVLKSRRFTSAYIEENNLLPILFAKKWDSESKAWLNDAPDKQPTLLQANELFSEDIRSVSTDKKSGVVTLGIRWTDPQLAALWANGLVVRLNAEMRERAVEDATRSINYLNEQLRQTSIVELQEAIYRLIEAQTKSIMLANVREQFAFKVIDPAVIPEEPIKPKRSLIAVLGLMLGGMVGVLAVFLRHAIRNRNAQIAAEAS